MEPQNWTWLNFDMGHFIPCWVKKKLFFFSANIKNFTTVFSHVSCRVSILILFLLTSSRLFYSAIWCIFLGRSLKIFIFVLVVCRALLFFCVVSNEHRVFGSSPSLHTEMPSCNPVTIRWNVSSRRSIICFLNYWAVMKPEHEDKWVILK